MDFALDQTTIDYRDRLLAFMDECVYPAEPVHAEQSRNRENPWSFPPIIAELGVEARKRGLWNLFLPGSHGAGLTNLQYAPLAEITGRSPAIAPAALNCSAPDTGNMEVLAEFGTEAQRKEWLEPLLDGRIRSAFAMTEPAVASSDATNVETRIERQGHEYVINGRKWFITGALNPTCKIFIVMGKTDPSAPRRRQQSQVLVPRDTPGLTVTRGMSVFGYPDGDHGGHAEVLFEDVRVPVDNLIGVENKGFIGIMLNFNQERLGMSASAYGYAKVCLDEAIAYARERHTFGKPLIANQVVRHRLVDMAMRINAVKSTLELLAYRVGQGEKPVAEICMLKNLATSTMEFCANEAMQIFGGAGYLRGAKVERIYRETKVMSIGGGSVEIMKDLAARQMGL